MKLDEIDAVHIPIPINLIFVGFNGEGNQGIVTVNHKAHKMIQSAVKALPAQMDCTQSIVSWKISLNPSVMPHTFEGENQCSSGIQSLCVGLHHTSPLLQQGYLDASSILYILRLPVTKANIFSTVISTVFYITKLLLHL